MEISEQNLIWIDMEMTGCDPLRHKVIEIASIVTDSQLDDILAEGPVIAIHQPQPELEAMDEWCSRTHYSSGLITRVQQSTIDEKMASQLMLDFLKQWVPEGASPMCGNSIGQDRRFMSIHMPTLERFFHYRNIDVSTVKELARRWNRHLLDAVKKSSKHLSLEDIRESIGELRYYQKNFFHLDT